MSQAQEIHFFYDKSRHFRVVHVDGAHGGLAPSGSADEMNITVSFYNERRPIPREEIVTVADGNLTIRDQTHPLSFPFNLDIEMVDGQPRFHLTSEVTIQRLEYGVGQGYWANTATIPNDVLIQIDVYAAP